MYQDFETFKCEHCDEDVEYDMKDIEVTSSSYEIDFYVKCSCCGAKNILDVEMDSDFEYLYKKQFEDKKSCSDCKYLKCKEEGYSEYTITGHVYTCMLKESDFCLHGDENELFKKKELSCAANCSNYESGCMFKAKIGESEGESYKKWVEKNKNKNYY